VSRFLMRQKSTTFVPSAKLSLVSLTVKAYHAWAGWQKRRLDGD